MYKISADTHQTKSVATIGFGISATPSAKKFGSPNSTNYSVVIYTTWDSPEHGSPTVAAKILDLVIL